MTSWQTKSSRVAYENPWMIVHEDQVVRPDGEDGLYGYIESKSDSVYVVPVDDEGNTYIVKQARYTRPEPTWECVAGRMDGETTELAGKRELLEETGVQANTITTIGTLAVAAGIATFRSIVCVARDLEKVSDDLDAADGIIEARKLPLSEAIDMISTGQIVCSESIAALYMTSTYLNTLHNTEESH